MKVILKKVRLSFPVLWEPEQFEQGQGKARYSAVFLVEPGSANDKAIRSAIATEAKATWGEAKAKAQLANLAPQTGKFCYQDGELKSDKYAGYEGNWALSAHRNADQGAPAVVDRDRSPLSPESGKPYSGCYVNASVDVWVQKGQYTGVRCTLIGIQFCEDGEAFAGAPATADDFEALEGANDDFSDFAETDDEFSEFGV
jgi:hypothetical protein